MIAKEDTLIKEFSRSNQPVLVINGVYQGIKSRVCEQLKISQEALVEYLYSENVEELRGKILGMYARPLSSEYKLLCLFGVDSLSAEQANTLLKLIEEPPSYARIILYAQNLSRVMLTIRSRSKLFVFPEQNKAYDGELSFNSLLNGSFFNFSKEISNLEREDFTSLLLKGIEERRKNLLNKSDFKILEKMMTALMKVNTTNANFRLVAEEIYLVNKK